MRILHILRKAPDEWTKEAIKRHSQSMEVTVLLIQEGVLIEEKLPGRLVLALDEDVKKRNLSIDLPRIDYASMVRLLFENDRVICW